ncbi:MAG TPA: hypothetical protein VF329_15725 [Gammaproteobacteria bacterium]
MSAENDLATMLQEGPVADLLRAEEALQVATTIGSHADAVNASNFRAILISLQSYSVEQFVLAVTRLYDRPHPHYSLRSLPAVLEFVRTNAGALQIRQPTWVERGVARLGITISANGDQEHTTIAVADELIKVLPTPKNNAALNALKALRDKRLAHPENIEAEQIPRTTWEPAEALLEPPKQIVGILGSYTSTAYVDDEGAYLLSLDAQRASTSLRRLLREIRVAPPAFPPIGE